MIPLLALSISLRKTQAQGDQFGRLPLVFIHGETYGDQFGRNLNNVLDDLVHNMPSTGVNVSSYGVSPNRVYGLLQCRGDASQKECYDCCQNVMTNVSNCENRIECKMLLTICDFYYSNDSSSSSLIGSFSIGDVFMQGQKMAFRNLLSNLSIEASTSIKRFAEGTSVDSSGHQIYALVQCDRIIPTANCSNCLANALQVDPYYSSIYFDDCYVLLSNQSVNTTASAIPPTPSAIPPNRSEKLPCMNLRLGRGVLLGIALLLLSM